MADDLKASLQLNLTTSSAAGPMSDRPKTKFLFLSPFTDGRTVSRRDLELQDSNARSHAAHVTHTRLKSVPTLLGERQPKRSRFRRSVVGCVDCPTQSSTVSAANATSQRIVGRSGIGNVPAAVTTDPDPFSTYPHPLTTDSASYAQYFGVLWTGLATKAAPPTCVQLAVRDASVKDIIRLCMQDQLAHEAFTAAMAMRMISVHNMTATGGSADRAASRAMSSLRTRISSHRPFDLKLFLSIMFLAGYETYTYNFAGCRVHLKLLQELDAKNVLDDFQMSYIHNLDVFCASATLCPPVFPVEDSTTSPRLGDPRAKTMGTAFAKHHALLGSTLSESIIPSIADCAYAARLCRQCFPTTTMAEWNSMIKGVVRTCSSLTSRLLCCKPTSPPQEAVIIALLILLSYLPIGTLSSSASEVFRNLIPSREQMLLERVSQWDDNDQHLRLWVSSVGLVFSVETGTTKAFAKEVDDMRRALGLDKTATECLMNSYLWMECSGLLRCGGSNLDILYAE